MAPEMDSRNGYSASTRTYHTLRPSVTLPSPTQPLSLTDYVSHLSPATSLPKPFLTTPSTGHVITYSDFFASVKSLAVSVRSLYPTLTKNDVALVLSPASAHVPLVYFSLLSLGITVCPANPVATESELSHMVGLVKPVVAFATSSVLDKLPDFPLGTVVLDSQRFQAMTSYQPTGTEQRQEVKVDQSDRAAILFSSGTTGRVKGVELTHRNLIALIAGYYFIRREEDNAPHPVSLFFIPMFHVFGFFMLFRGAAIGETFVLMERFDFEKMLKAVETYKVTYMPVSPPLVVAMAKSDLAEKYDLSSLRLLGSGGAPLGKEVSESFTAKFPGIEIIQIALYRMNSRGRTLENLYPEVLKCIVRAPSKREIMGYGLTETCGSATRMIEPHEIMKFGSVGLLAENLEAKIVDPSTGEALPPNQRGELWLRGPTVMKGYIGDDDATSATFDRDGWLKTGDLCYFDSDGFIYVVDRLKELIKYKAYQVPPAELEHLLQGHPEIADAAVVPYPDEEAGQIPMAFIVRKPGSRITAAQIMDFIANQVSPYKKIRRVAFINSIPKSPAGKILRRELVNHAVSGTSSKL